MRLIGCFVLQTTAGVQIRRVHRADSAPGDRHGHRGRSLHDASYDISYAVLYTLPQLKLDGILTGIGCSVLEGVFVTRGYINAANLWGSGSYYIHSSTVKYT